MSYLIRFCFMAFVCVILPTYILLASFQQEIQQKCDDLMSHKEAFFSFDSSMTELEHVSLRKLKIDKFDEYDNFGDPNLLEQQVRDFLNSLGSQEGEVTQVLANLVTRLNNAVTQASQKETSWVCLRTFKDTTAFDHPRWHIDGGYYEPFGSTQLKFAITLKGPGTLFYLLSQDERQKYIEFTSTSWQKIRMQFDQSFQQKTMTEEERQDEKNKLYEQAEKIFLNQMIQRSQIISLPLGQGMIFKVGNLETAALHSEPPIKENRLFLSIVPCDFKDIDGMRQRLGA